MDHSDVMSLVALPTLSSGDVSETETTVFCRVRSVGYRETYAAAAVGLRPELTVSIAEAADYAGQPFVRFHDALYKIIRTYMTGLGIDLTLARPVGLKDQIEKISLIRGADKTEIYAAVAYLQMSEVEDAGVYGLRRELHLIIGAENYDGQDLIEFNGKTYAVARAYQEDNAVMDLYVEERVGL